MKGGKKRPFGVHKAGGFTWIPRGVYSQGSIRYTTEVMCPCCKRKRWVMKTTWQSTIDQGREFTRICRKCRGKSRRMKKDFDFFNLIDDVTFSANIKHIGDFNRIFGHPVKEKIKGGIR